VQGHPADGLGPGDEATGKVELALTCSSLTAGACDAIQTVNFGTADGTVITSTYQHGAVTRGNGTTTADTSFLATTPGGATEVDVACNCPPAPTWIASWQSV
jgi:hypothetical protein